MVPLGLDMYVAGVVIIGAILNAVGAFVFVSMMPTRAHVAVSLAIVLTQVLLLFGYYGILRVKRLDPFLSTVDVNRLRKLGARYARNM